MNCHFVPLYKSLSNQRCGLWFRSLEPGEPDSLSRQWGSGGAANELNINSTMYFRIRLCGLHSKWCTASTKSSKLNHNLWVCHCPPVFSDLTALSTAWHNLSVPSKTITNHHVKNNTHGYPSGMIRLCFFGTHWRAKTEWMHIKRLKKWKEFSEKQHTRKKIQGLLLRSRT